MDDGEIRYKTSRDLGSDTLAELLPPLLYANVLSLDRYFPASCWSLTATSRLPMLVRRSKTRNRF